MEKLLNLVAALNAFNDEVSNETRIAVYLKEKDGDKDKQVRYFIKHRPVMGDNGVETWKYVARREE